LHSPPLLQSPRRPRRAQLAATNPLPSLPPRQVATVGAPVALLARTEDEIAAVAASGGGAAAAAPAPAAAAPAAPAPAVTVGSGSGYTSANKMATPAAKKLAKSKGLKWEQIPGSGNFGRVTVDDVLVAAGEAPRAAPAPAPAAAAPAAAPAPAPAAVPAGGRVVASPFARSLAESKGVDLSTVVGTGPDGRIVAEDVEKAAASPAAAGAAAAPAAKASSAAPAAPAPAGVVPMTGMQKAVVKNMAWADSVPTYTVSRQIVTDDFDALYAQLKPKGVTVSAMLAKAVGLALAKHPIMNSNYVEDGISYNSDINVAMAVAMPDGGLITPVLKNADTTDIYSLGRAWKDLVPRAMEGARSPPTPCPTLL